MTMSMHSQHGTEAASFILQTGKPGCHAIFYPNFYQLKLIQQGKEEIVELGFSGSRVLERLLREPGQLVSREELLERGWPGRVVGQGSLNQQIHTLRQILGDDQQRNIIQTVPRRGYLFNPAYFAAISVPEPRNNHEPLAPKKPWLARQLFATVAAKLRRLSAAALMSLGGLSLGLLALGYGSLAFSQVKLVSTEVNGGKAYILYVGQPGKPGQPQELVMRRNMEELATIKYLD
ncbi:MAG: CadC family transcriptional regulator [Xanthomonadaceae bacterium]|nr:CadC family transcriptional regulator [Xanthomonadaceae bacterium]